MEEKSLWAGELKFYLLGDLTERVLRSQPYFLSISPMKKEMERMLVSSRHLSITKKETPPFTFFSHSLALELKFF